MSECEEGREGVSECEEGREGGRELYMWCTHTCTHIHVCVVQFYCVFVHCLILCTNHYLSVLFYLWTRQMHSLERGARYVCTLQRIMLLLFCTSIIGNHV